MAAVAFLGTGNMGAGMAGRLIAAGHAVRVYNRTRARATALGGAGARVCATPREAADGAEAVFAMVGDDAASAAVWLTTTAPSARPGKTARWPSNARRFPTTGRSIWRRKRTPAAGATSIVR